MPCLAILQSIAALTGSVSCASPKAQPKRMKHTGKNVSAMTPVTPSDPAAHAGQPAPGANPTLRSSSPLCAIRRCQTRVDWACRSRKSRVRCQAATRSSGSASSAWAISPTRSGWIRRAPRSTIAQVVVGMSNS